MSSYTSVAVIGHHRFDELFADLQSWADRQEQVAEFLTMHGQSNRLAADARVIVGQVNHLDHDSLLATVRDAMREPDWGFYWPRRGHHLERGRRVLALPPRQQGVLADGELRRQPATREAEPAVSGRPVRCHRCGSTSLTLSEMTEEIHTLAGVTERACV